MPGGGAVLEEEEAEVERMKEEGKEGAVGFWLAASGP